MFKIQVHYCCNTDQHAQEEKIPESQKNWKNIIVIKMDELRYDQLGYMNHPVVKTLM
ncbi:MAG: hypothetical protein ACOCVN_01410 [bacterium]